MAPSRRVKPARAAADTTETSGTCAIMKELARTNNLVLISWLRALLSDSDIECLVLDNHVSVIEGSAGAIPRRLMVADHDFAQAKRLFPAVIAAGLSSFVAHRALQCIASPVHRQESVNAVVTVKEPGHTPVPVVVHPPGVLRKILDSLYELVRLVGLQPRLDFLSGAVRGSGTGSDVLVIGIYNRGYSRTLRLFFLCFLI